MNYNQSIIYWLQSDHKLTCFLFCFFTSGNCPAGEEHTSDGSCVPCQRGFFKEPNDVLCRPCDPAYITESVGSISEKSCTLRLS